jgi:hypothetical protein
MLALPMAARDQHWYAADVDIQAQSVGRLTRNKRRGGWSSRHLWPRGKPRTRTRIARRRAITLQRPAGRAANTYVHAAADATALRCCSRHCIAVTSSSIRSRNVEDHQVENNGLRWTMRFRDGPLFHDGTPVLACDCVASLLRWIKRDPIGQTIADRLEALEAPDDTFTPSVRAGTACGKCRPIALRRGACKARRQSEGETACATRGP